MNQQIAFLGLGVMGAPMALNLIRNGYAVNIWNRTSDRPALKNLTDAGAIAFPSIRAAVTTADIIFTCLGDVPDVEAVILGDAGIAECARVGALVVDTSTIGLAAAQKIAEVLAERQMRFLDAPVSGGDIGAQQGTLTFMVGGAQTDFEECHPLFAAMGKNIRLCGDVGSGQAVKLCNQVLVSMYMVGICEAMLLAEHMGIEPSLIVEICGSGAAASWALSNLGMKVANSDLQPGFMIKHMLKDLRLVQEVANSSEQEFAGVELANHLFQIVSQLDGGNGQGTQAMIRAYQQKDVMRSRSKD